MHGAPLPQYAFMAWCSVKKETQGNHINQDMKIVSTLIRNINI